MSNLQVNRLSTKDGSVDIEVRNLLVRDSAMENLGDYEEGLELQTVQQYFIKDGHKFVGKAFQLPIVLSGNWDIDKVLVETYGEQWDHSKLFNKDIPNAHDASDIGFEYKGVVTNVHASLNALLFKNIEEMKSATDLKEGMIARTLGYYAPGDGGGNDYEIVAADTGTDDGGSFIDLVGSGLQVKGLFADGIVNVKQFGAKGDDQDDDTPAIQNAVNYSKGSVYFPAGEYVLNSTVNLPFKDLELYGEREASTIKGPASPRFSYPSNVLLNSRSVVQNIRKLGFHSENSQVSIQLHQTWNAAFKNGPTISDCFFRHTDTIGNNATAISLQGVYTCSIHSNYFYSGGYAEKDDYAVKVVLGAGMNTSVMNVLFSGNHSIGMSYGFHIPDRVGDGRAEGINISDNQFVRGKKAIRSSQVLALSVTGNLLSDWEVCVESVGDFNSNICSNTEVDGSIYGIHIKSRPGATENYSVTGNVFRVNKQGGVGICIENDTSHSAVRNITISGNVIGGNTGSTPISSTGILFKSKFISRAITISGNTFSNLKNGIEYTLGENQYVFLNNSTYFNVGNRVVNAELSGTLIDKVYKVTPLVDYKGGAFEIITIPIPSGVFKGKPEEASAVMDGRYTDVYVGFYDKLSTTNTTAQFAMRAIQANVPTSSRVTHVVMHGVGYATE